MGHVYSIDFASKYNDWNKVDPTELFDAQIVQQEANPKTRVAANLANEAKGADCLVLWLDCDREGENICFEVIQICSPYLNTKTPNLCKLSDPSVPPNVFRVKFSSLVDSDLRQAFAKNLILPNIHEAQSVDARQEIDLRLGVAFTRFLTKYFVNRYGDLGTSLVSYGPCQLPTLWFCVKRKEEHDLFHPTDFYTILLSASRDGKQYTFRWCGGKIYDQTAAKALIEIFGRVKIVRVKSKEMKEIKVSRPLPLNTVALLKRASTVCGIGPQRAMQIAEHLYLRGLITYPRTESTAFAASFDLKGTLAILSKGSFVSTSAKNLLQQQLSAPRKGTDAGDHPPITPCGNPLSDLDGDQAAIYRLVAESFLACLAGDAIYSETKIQLSLTTPETNEHIFATSERRLLEAGFLAVQGTDAEEMSSDCLDSLQKGMDLSVDLIKIQTDQDSRPSLITESALLGLMEKHGIGTDASMAQHIQNILDRNYVTLIGSTRQLCPTKLGQALCSGLERFDPELAKPVIRSIIENQCHLIAKGQADKKRVIDHVIVEFKVKFQHLLRSISVVDTLFEISFTTIADAGTSFSRCGNCNRYMSYVSKPPQRLICKICSTMYHLPMNSTVRTWSDQRCPYDNFETVLVQERNGKAYTLCPMCYNDPPMQGMLKMRCCDCNHPTCDKGFLDRMIDECYEDSCEGTLYLQSWPGVVPALVCSSCSVFNKLDPTKVSVVTKAKPFKNCDQCGWFLVKAQAQKAHKFSDGQNSFIGCLGCHDDLVSVLTVGGEHRHRGKGRGRGRGRRRRAFIDPKMTFDRF